MGDKQTRFKAFLCFSMMFVIVGLNSACITWTVNNQEHGFRFGTDISWYSKSSQTGTIKSETGIESTVLDGLLEENNTAVVVPDDDG